MTLLRTFMSHQDNFDIDYLIRDRKVFDDFIYTPLDGITDVLRSREQNTSLANYINSSIPIEIPKFLKSKKYAFLSRDVATPNFETKRFIDVVSQINDLSPLFWEYHQDKFTPNVNIAKYNLGKPSFYLGEDKKGGERRRSINLIDFNTYNGHKMSNIKTLWDEEFVRFHHDFLRDTLLEKGNHSVSFFDASSWYIEAGGEVKTYYKYVLLLFLRNGVLFENFLLNDKEEILFIKKVFLPAFIEIYKECGKKPLIVALAPTETEGNDFWMYYPAEAIQFVKNKMNLL